MKNKDCKQAIFELQLWATELVRCFMAVQRHSQWAPVRLWSERNEDHTQRVWVCKHSCRELNQHRSTWHRSPLMHPHKHTHTLTHTHTVATAEREGWCLHLSSVTTEAKAFTGHITGEVLHKLLIWPPSICLHCADFYVHVRVCVCCQPALQLRDYNRHHVRSWRDYEIPPEKYERGATLSVKTSVRLWCEANKSECRSDVFALTP